MAKPETVDVDAKQIVHNMKTQGRVLKRDLTLHSFECERSGETVYCVCDSVGLVHSTIFPNKLDRFFTIAP